MLFGQSGSIQKKVVVIRQSGSIHAKWLYLGKVVVFGQKLSYSGKSACIVAKVVVIGKK